MNEIRKFLVKLYQYLLRDLWRCHDGIQFIISCSILVHLLQHHLSNGSGDLNLLSVHINNSILISLDTYHNHSDHIIYFTINFEVSSYLVHVCLYILIAHDQFFCYSNQSLQSASISLFFSWESEMEICQYAYLWIQLSNGWLPFSAIKLFPTLRFYLCRTLNYLEFLLVILSLQLLHYILLLVFKR